jgi:uncharacterized protein YciI
MARRILQWKGGKMRILCLCILAISSLARAQEAPAHFLIEFELTVGVDIAHLSETQMAVFQQHGAQLMKLRNDGVVVVGGHTDNMQHMRAFVIVKAKDAAAARIVGAEDPAVKGGLLKFSVEPFTLAIPPK